MQIGLAGPQQLYQTATRLVQAMGYRDADQFFQAPQQQPPQQPQQPEQSPEAQALIAAEQIKSQATLKKAEMDNQVRLQIAREEIASKERVAIFEAQEKLRLEAEKRVPALPMGLPA